MDKSLIVYNSRGGNTKAMAEAIAEGMKKEQVEVEIRDVKNVAPEDLLDYDAIIVGSPTYYGSMAAEIKKMFDNSQKIHGKLDGKVGAAFSSSIQIGGGNETTILDILNAMLIHGMIVQGDWQGDHYGPVSIGFPDASAMKLCNRDGFGPWYGFKQCSIEHTLEDINNVEIIYREQADYLTSSHSYVVSKPDFTPFKYMRG